MLSTLLNYRIHASDIPRSLERVRATDSVGSDTKYYENTIGRVESVDDLLGDSRLYTYALKAYGLENQAASKAFIRKVLESDLSNRSSFANTLADDRYRKFAAAFDFTRASAVESAQSTRQTEDLVEAYSEYRVRQGAALAGKTSYFEKRMATITSVDELLADPTLFDVMLRSIGADPRLTSKEYVRGVFTYASENGPSASDDRFVLLARRFAFNAAGNVPSGQVALDAAKTSKLIYDFNLKTGNGGSAQAAAHNTRYYADMIGGVDNVTDIVNDPRMLEYIQTAFTLPNTTPDYIKRILTSDPSDPNSTLNKAPIATSADIAYKERLTLLRQAFNFDTAGAVPAGQSAQTDAARESLIERYHNGSRSAAQATDASKTSTYKFLLADISSVADLLVRDAVFGRDAIDYVLRALDLDPASESNAKLRRVLQSDTSDPNSYVNRLNDERYEKLAAAFNFGTDGKIRGERMVQSTASQAATGARYSASFGATPTETKKELIKADTRKYLEAVSDLRTLDDLLASDTVVNFALRAYGLDDDKPTAAELRKIFASDLGDPSSYVYSLEDPRYVDLASAFNFDAKGQVKVEEDSVQRPAAQLATQNLYLLATLEERAGEASEGARLALYFRRRAPEITSTLKLLADPALVEVVKTALGLPDSLSQLDLDRQVALIEKRLKTSDLQDPRKLDRFISRFAALYDLNNADPAQTSPVLGLFSGQGSGERGGLLGIF